MAQSTVPQSSVCADWRVEDDTCVLRVKAANPREAWSTRLIGLSLALGVASGGLAFLGSSNAAATALTAVLAAALCVTFVGYMRLSAQAREMTFIIGERSLSIDDGVKRDEVSLSDVHRLLIVHDGSSARIAVDSVHGRFRCSIGQMYRHNRLERFVAQVPIPALRWLEAAGATHTESTKRGVLWSTFRASSPRHEPQ